MSHAVQNQSTASHRRRSQLSAALAGLVCLALLLSLSAVFQLQRSRQEQLQMEYIARTIEAETYETLLLQVEKTQVLEAHLMETGGSYDSFAPIAQRLLSDNPAIQNVLFAPNGIVARAFPAAGNEETIGLDLNSNGQGNLEAHAAIQTGELFLAGPFELVEGGMGICGRLPIYLDNENQQPTYWGLVSVSLRYPDIFADHPIHTVNAQDFAGYIWRINPDTGRRQTVLETAQPIPANAAAVQYEMKFFNVTWTLELAPLTVWYARPSLWIMAAASLLISLLAVFGVYARQELRALRAAEASRQIRDLQQQLEREQTNAMLNQISSHFFYHTLNALQALIVLNPDAAYRMAGDFSRYLRFNVDALMAEGGTVHFRDELRATRSYAQINVQQLGPRLNVEFDVPEVDFRIPALTLQPIVENAIIHGIKPKVGGGTVKVSLQEDAKHYFLRVQDDGLGFDPLQQQKQQSVGLSNVRRRIEQFPGCGLDIVSAPNCGTTVVLTYPKSLDVGE